MLRRELLCNIASAMKAKGKFIHVLVCLENIFHPSLVESMGVGSVEWRGTGCSLHHGVTEISW